MLETSADPGALVDTRQAWATLNRERSRVGRGRRLTAQGPNGGRPMDAGR